MARGGIFRKDHRSKASKRLSSLPPEVPILIDLDVIDITVEIPAVDFEIALVERPELLTVTVEIPAVTVEQPQDVIADLDPIDIEIALQAIDGEKVIDLDLIDVTTELPAVLPLIGYALQPIDITVERPGLTIIQTSYDIDVIDITTEPLAVDVGLIYDIDPVDVDVTTSNMGVNPQWIVEVDPIDITIEPTFIQVIQTAYAINLIDITVTTQDIDVAYEHEVDAIDVSTQLPGVDPANIVDVPPIDITIQLPTVITYQSWRIGIIDVTTELPAINVEKVVDSSIVDISHEWPVVDPAHIFDIPSTIPITVVLPPASTLGFDDEPIQIQVEVLPVDAGFGVEQFALRRGEVARPVIQPTRIIAQSILTKEFLHWELPVSNVQVTYALSGPNVITGEFTNEILDLRDAGLEPYGTWIHVEEDGYIRASGILMPTSLDQNEKLSIEAVGFSSYPAGIPYMSSFSAIGMDAADVVRHIWAHLQSFPDAALGVTVVGTTNKTVGDPVPPPDENGNIPTDTGPYKLDWWEAPDCGAEISNLAQEAPFDFVERSEWNADKTDVKHYIDISYPRKGTRRYDLRFAQDENLLTAVGPEEVEGYYASSVILMGKGEGSSVIRGYAGRPSPKRIRRVAILDDATVDNVTRANALCSVELERRQAFLDINEVEIDARHPNARLGSFSVGDEIQLWAYVPWIGEIRQWERVTGYTYSPETDSIRVEMQRAESFIIPSTVVPPSTPPAPIPPPPVTVGSIVEFDGDFSTNNFSEWANIQNVVRNGSASGYDQTHYSARIEAAGDGHPNAFRCEVRSGDVALGVGGARSEIRTSSGINWTEGEERWFEFSIKFLSTFPKPGGSTSWCIPLQFHAGTGSPPVALNIPTNSEILHIENHADSATYPPIPIGPIDKGNWVDYVLHIKFSNDPELGFVEVWRNKTKVIPLTSRRTMNSAENYLKCGLYRDTDETQTMVLWHDGMRITRNA